MDGTFIKVYQIQNMESKPCQSVDIAKWTGRLSSPFQQKLGGQPMQWPQQWGAWRTCCNEKAACAANLGTKRGHQKACGIAVVWKKRCSSSVFFVIQWGIFLGKSRYTPHFWTNPCVFWFNMLCSKCGAETFWMCSEWKKSTTRAPSLSPGSQPDCFLQKWVDGWSILSQSASPAPWPKSGGAASIGQKRVPCTTLRSIRVRSSYISG